MGMFTAQAGLILLCGVAVSWAIIFGERCIARYAIVARLLRPENFDPDTVRPRSLDKATMDAWLRLRSEQAGNVIIYRGTSPFLGAGQQIGKDPAWQLVVDVERPKDALLDDLDAKPQRFELDELHDHLRKALNQLEMEGLVIEDHLYVDARKTLPKGFWDYRERRLQTWVDSDVVRSYMRRPSETIRHFRAVRVISWSGQLVVTVFLHVTRTGPLLYIRTRYHCLTPLKPRFEQADSVPPVPILPDVLRQAAAALGELIEGAVHPSRWFRPGLAIRHLRRRAFPPREDGRLTGLRERLGWYRIYWRRTSIRARASDHGVRWYFQLVDTARSVQMIERCLLNALVSFLNERGVDTSDLVRQQTTILNNGVIVSGNGQINTDNIAVGDNASAGNSLLDNDRESGA